jgi:hypothetical protein
MASPYHHPYFESKGIKIELQFMTSKSIALLSALSCFRESGVPGIADQE